MIYSDSVLNSDAFKVEPDQHVDAIKRKSGAWPTHVSTDVPD